MLAGVIQTHRFIDKRGDVVCRELTAAALANNLNGALRHEHANTAAFIQYPDINQEILSPLRAVAGLIDLKSASSLVEGARAPSARTPSTMESSTKEAICLNSGCVELSIAIVIAPVVEVELSSPTKLVRYSCN